ncbi:riboflavin kinase isoform X3 [Polistes fuscatus]|uniref:riboflavin kinase isoform X3 n=1 Tax=Polistes fuscatus TaxID=30207 RepID=UPI001CA9B74F|nr:riboflavin kinase isoform X3 [Polistes fuscatus]
MRRSKLVMRFFLPIGKIRVIKKSYLTNLPECVVDSLPENFNTGVYYGWVALNGTINRMVASVGWNPFYKNEKKTFEVHILETFSNDFYGEELKVIVTGYIRQEKDFTSAVYIYIHCYCEVSWFCSMEDEG